MPEEVRWGIIGTANIAEKVCVAIKEASNASVWAVASREKAKAETFIGSNCPGATAYGSYEELLDDEKVQAVYIPLPTGMRTEWVLKAAAKKKHVLCEKPIAPNARDAARIIDACQAAGVQFMDNTMMMHGERWESMQKVLDDHEFFGKVCHVASCFTIPFGLQDDWENIRVKRSLEPLGALGDLGWYCARFTSFAFGYEDPEAVSCHFLAETSEGVPTTAVATLKYSGGRTATFDCSFRAGYRQWAEITTEKCTLNVEDFVIPKADVCSYKICKGNIAEKALTFPNDVVRTEEFKGTPQHTRLIEKMSSIVVSGELEEIWPKVSKQTQLLLGALVSSARQQAAWVTPREPAPKGKGKGKAQAEVVKKQATFASVAKIDPGSRGLNLQVKVVSVDGSKAVVGDASAVVTFNIKGADQVGLVKEGASLVLRNASVKMATGFITLEVDKWGKVQAGEEDFAFEPNKDTDVSSREFELVQT